MAPSPSHPHSSGSIIFASRYLPTYFGGLGHYQRLLAIYIDQHYGFTGRFIAENLRGKSVADVPADFSWQFITLDEKEQWKLGRKFCSRLASRTSLHPLLEKVVAMQWADKIQKALPEKAAHIHYIGTGWDFFGFAMLQQARRLGIGFTVWPAVHPGDWGDDVIDIRLYNAADKIFAQSDYEKTWLMGKGLAESKITRSGLPPMCATTGDSAKFRDKFGLEGRPIVLFIGRRDEGKGYFAVLRVWEQVRARFPDACLVTIGPYADAAQRPSLQEENGVLDLGAASEDDKADALAACNVFCLPSAHESFGIVYIEAWSYAKPVICGTAPACRELVQNDVTGLWASQEPQDLCDAICQILGEPQAAVLMGLRGKAEQMSKYTWEKVSQTHLKEFGLVPA